MHSSDIDKRFPIPTTVWEGMFFFCFFSKKISWTENDRELSVELEEAGLPPGRRGLPLQPATGAQNKCSEERLERQWY